MAGKNRIFLSPPHMGGEELELVKQVFASNWIAPVGKDLTEFENEFSRSIGASFAVALSSGTAALHLSLLLRDVGKGDQVICSDFTFVAAANAIRYTGAEPVFVDSTPDTWNIAPELLEEMLSQRSKTGKFPKAAIIVHLYGQCADMDEITRICSSYDIPIIEDAAESLGATYKGKSAGTMSLMGVFSFNGNKIITTSAGGMFVTDDKKSAERVRYLATQAREPVRHYQHRDVGYNYRLSNVLAAIGRGQLRVLEKRVKRKREIFQHYQKELSDLPGVEFMPEASYGKSSRWLSCITIDPQEAPTDRNRVIDYLEKENIESRPTWKPMHMQPVYQDCEVIGGNISQQLFEQGLCLPSGTAMTEADLDRICQIVRSCFNC